jgi:hypothetical protein
MIDLKRRFFLFGVTAAALVVPPPKSFFVMKPPKLIVEPIVANKLFDLPLQQMMDLMRKLDEQVIEASAIPRWVIMNKDDFDTLVSAPRKTAYHWRSQWPSTAPQTSEPRTT